MGIKGALKAMTRPLRPGKANGKSAGHGSTGRVRVERVLSVSRPLDIESTSSEGDQLPLPAELEGLHPPEDPDTSSSADVGLMPSSGGSHLTQRTPQKRAQEVSAPHPPQKWVQMDAGASPSPSASPLPVSKSHPPHVPDVVELAAGSPFLDLGSPITAFEAVKMVLMFPIIVLRVLLLLVTLILGYSVMALLMTCVPSSTPLGNRTRHSLVQAWVQILCHAALFLSGFFFVRVTGRHNLKQAKTSRAIVIFNHLSYVDPVLLVSLLPLSGVAKAGVAGLPFIGALARAMQWLFVERRGSSDRANAHTIKGNALEAIHARVADRGAPLLVMAPEATTKAAQCLLKFRRGAFANGHPVCPILISYPHRRFNPAWGIVPSTPLHVYRLLAQPYNQATVHIMPTYFPSTEEREDPNLYAAGVRLAMATELKAPLVEQGIAEERRLVKAGVNVNLLGTALVFRGSKADGGAIRPA